ncbi:hypothetical protein RvVAR0630_11970 [Agrobacterium vitis]|uniref:Shedu anti-phage system protein SduA domain-containing protein n=1 Tax=Agrobacterium vitis TaxID=373 RepID=UPI0015D8A20C|nr:Shedu anti-phage system protein SduA domain-containing protein [Agrobacterium vitis]BCH58573.1 hypothetical protein RvVAR0630_11970 [Agrobacterium vitis]
MKKFKQLAIDISILDDDLHAFEMLLNAESHLKERDQIIPFFKQRPHLCAALGFLHGNIELPNLWSNELHLFGDFVCDAASGDSEANAFTLIEFEDAKEHSIFLKLADAKSMKHWSPRFEHGFSQIADWAWRLSTEGGGSSAFRRIFGDNDPVIHFVLIVGRDADLTDDDKARLRWRANNVSFGQYRMSCFTFDAVLGSLRRRLSLARQANTL